MNTKSYSPFLVGTMRGPWPLIRGGRLFAQFAVHTTAGWRYFEDRVESEARRRAEEFQKSLNPEP